MPSVSALQEHGPLPKVTICLPAGHMTKQQCAITSNGKPVATVSLTAILCTVPVLAGGRIVWCLIWMCPEW